MLTYGTMPVLDTIKHRCSTLAFSTSLLHRGDDMALHDAVQLATVKLHFSHHFPDSILQEHTRHRQLAPLTKATVAGSDGLLYRPLHHPESLALMQKLLTNTAMLESSM